MRLIKMDSVRRYTTALCLLFLFVHHPAGADIVFTSNRDGQLASFDNEIYVMNDDGSNVRRITHDGYRKRVIRWSPDGRHLLFSRDVDVIDSAGQKTDDIFLMNADGHQLRRLIEHPALDGQPAWAPDGQRIAFASSRDGMLEIYVLHLDSGVLRQLTHSEAEVGGYATSPDWSPDGREIAYALALPGQGRHIYLIDADGERNRPLVKQAPLIVETTLMNFSPRWSPDGERILYGSVALAHDGNDFRAVSDRLMIRDRDGSNPQFLATPKIWRLGAACWAEEGTVILFVATETKSLVDTEFPPTDIYRYELASHQITNLTNHPSEDWGADWTAQSLSVSVVGRLTTQWGKIKAGKSPMSVQ